jgi:hypothetical protein
MEDSANKKYILGAIVLVVIILIIGYFSTRQTVSLVYDDFAKCLASKNLTMYGAESCSHCKVEKNRFGTAFQYVPYVECPDNIKLCTDKGITGYPTWIDEAGNKHEGEQGLSNLAKISGCVLPE